MRIKVWVRLWRFHHTACHRDHSKHQLAVEAAAAAAEEEELKLKRPRDGAEAAVDEPAAGCCRRGPPSRFNTRGPRALLVAGSNSGGGRWVVFYNKKTAELVKFYQLFTVLLVMTPAGAGVTSTSSFCHQIPSLSVLAFAAVGQTLVFNIDFQHGTTLPQVLAAVEDAGEAARHLFRKSTTLPPALDLSTKGGRCAPCARASVRPRPLVLTRPRHTGRYEPEPIAKPILEQAQGANQQSRSIRGRAGAAAALRLRVGGAAANVAAKADNDAAAAAAAELGLPAPAKTGYVGVAATNVAA